MARKKVAPVPPPTVTAAAAAPSTRAAATRRARFADDDRGASASHDASEETRTQDTPETIDDDDLYAAPTADMGGLRTTRAAAASATAAGRSTQTASARRAAAHHEDPPRALIEEAILSDSTDEGEPEVHGLEAEDEGDDDGSSEDGLSSSVKSESGAESADEDPSDPVLRSYDVFLTSEMAEHLHLFQYPIRESGQGYTNAFQMEPIAARIKPKSGFVELDIPIPVRESYDVYKGSTWGKVIERNMNEAASATPGLAGGFVAGNYKGSRPKKKGPGSKKRSPGGPSDDDLDMLEDEVEPDYDSEYDQPRPTELEELFSYEPGSALMQGQTLGGKMYPSDGSQPHYMIGVFKDEQLHLTPLKTVVQLRPQFHQIDMYNDQLKAYNKSAKETPTAGGAGGTTFKSEARAVGLSVKSADGTDSTGPDSSGVTRTLRGAQDETWKQLSFFDENSEESWIAYSHLFTEKPDRAPRLRSAMSASEYLDAISPPRTDISGSKKAARLERDKGKEEEEEVRAASPKRTRDR